MTLSFIAGIVVGLGIVALAGALLLRSAPTWRPEYADVEVPYGEDVPLPDYQVDELFGERP